jgi:hypothetical protein
MFSAPARIRSYTLRLKLKVKKDTSAGVAIYRLQF